MSPASPSITSVYERIRDSLFLLPAALIGGMGVAAFVTGAVDRELASEIDTWWLLSTTVDSTRSILSTVATATITVAAIVFSMTAVVVQLATSQYSPRVTQGYLRDRYQQVTIGLTVGTFVYSLLVLAQVRGSEEGAATSHDVSATVALLLAVASMVAIVSFIDRMMRSMRIDTIVRRLADETESSIETLPERAPLGDEAIEHPDPDAGGEIPMGRTGWIRTIDTAGLLAALPGNTILRLDLRVGDFVADEEVAAMAWPAVDETVARRLRRAIEVGRTRTIHQDPAYGIRQMVDIALLALSPARNDATTGADVVHHLAGPLMALLRRQLPGRVASDDRGNRVYLPRALTHADYVHGAFREIRINSRRQPHVLHALLETLSSLIVVVEGDDHDGRASALRGEAAATVEVIRAADMPEADRRSLLAFARQVGLTDDLSLEPQ